MPRATRRALLATAPALAAGAAAPAELSEVAAAYAAYQPLQDSSPRERDFLFPGIELADDEHPDYDDIDYVAQDAAHEVWGPKRDAARQRLVDVQARSLADLTTKLQLAVGFVTSGYSEGDNEAALLSSCFSDLKAMQAG